MDLQTVWFLLVGVLLTGYAILDGFDLGVGMMHLFIAKSDHDRRVLVNSIGPVWDGNEVWLLTGGGAIFAAFPNVYATVFSGFYIALMLLLAALIVRAVSLEFRSKVESPRWRQSWDVAFAVGSMLPSLLFGVAIGNIVRGVPIGADGEYAGSFFTLLNPFALLVGVLSVAMFLVQGAAWLQFRTEGDLKAKSQRVGITSTWILLATWIVVTAYSRVAAPGSWSAFANPVAFLAPLVFVASVLALPPLFRKELPGRTFFVSSLAIAALLATLGLGLYPNMVPALGDAANSLTIYNASSSNRTLVTMLAIALAGMPVVIGYTIFIYRRFMQPVVLDEHSY
ncbi:MAG: cytochrome d ubiquinol oxidase subunit II [Thermoanaerobaculia bacterium]|nr:cytochrome d ubiquinol oxidase subunit II [Thermoanaerobaculia bacterium]